MKRRPLRQLELLVWIALGLPCAADSQTRIVLDGRFDDWTGVAAASTDGALRITHDERRLLLSLELDREIQIQDGNRLEMYLDTDGDPDTGCLTEAPGAELLWRFGERRGAACDDGRRLAVRHQDIGLITAPTVTSARFEIGLDRAARPGGPLFMGGRVRVRFSGEGLRGGSIDYEPRDGPLPDVQPASFRKLDPGHIRFLSHNLNGRLLSSPAEVFARVYGAIGADLHLFQEIRGTEPDRIVGLLRTWVPALAGKRLYSAAAGLDGGRGRDTNVLVSPFPILESGPVGGSGAFLLDLDPATDSRMLVVVLSLPCCMNHASRGDEIDQILALLRESRAGRGRMPLRDGTPILLMGDANLVGPATQRSRLLDGTVADPARHGASSAPDWDGTALRDALPRHLQAPLTYTWYAVESQGFSPGRLDYALYTDSVLEVANSFVLHTPEIPRAALSDLGLEVGDTPALSHHLPVVLDLQKR